MRKKNEPRRMTSKNRRCDEYGDIDREKQRVSD